MANQTLTKPCRRDIPISFEISAGQSTNKYSIGKWRPVSQSANQPDTFFQIPPDKQYRLIDIRQTKNLEIDLLFGYIHNGFLKNIAFDVNRANVINNKNKAIPPTIVANPLDTIGFIAYPTTSPKEAVTETVNAVFIILPVQWYFLSTR